MAVLSIDSTGTFKAYKTQFIAIDNHIIKYNINYKRFSFKILLKSEIMNPIIKPVKKDIIDWEMTVTTFQ